MVSTIPTPPGAENATVTARPATLFQRLVSGDGMNAILARTAAVTGIGFAAAQAMKLVSNLINTRLLSEQPEAFGLMGVALTINAFVVMLTDVGINTSIIRSDNGENPRFLRTAWVTTILRNAGLCLLVLAVAGLIALFQGQGVFVTDSILERPELPLVMAALGANLAIIGFASVNMALARRRMTPVKITLLELFVQFVSSVATIYLCWSGWGVWGLVAGTSVGALMLAVLTHVTLDGPRMGFAWSADDFRELFGFGKWLLLASFAGFIVNQADKVIFAFYFEEASYSLYVIAAIWIAAIVLLFRKLMQMVFYPAISRSYRADATTLVKTYATIRWILDAVCLTVFAVLLVGDELMFAVLYEPPYDGARRYFGVLILTVLLLPYQLLNTVLLSVGNSKRFTIVTGVGAAFTVIAVPIGYGIGGEDVAVMAFVAREIATSLTTLWLTRATIKPTLWREGRMLFAFGIGAAFVLGGV